MKIIKPEDNHSYCKTFAFIMALLILAGCSKTELSEDEEKAVFKLLEDVYSKNYRLGARSPLQHSFHSDGSQTLSACIAVIEKDTAITKEQIKRAGLTDAKVIWKDKKGNKKRLQIVDFEVEFEQSGCQTGYTYTSYDKLTIIPTKFSIE